MRITTKKTFLLASLYVAITITLLGWMEMELRASVNGTMADIAELIGREVTSALRHIAVEDLMRDEQTTRSRLRASIDALAHRSSLTSTLSIVDSNGRVVVSDDPQWAGRQLKPPAEEFAKIPGSHLLNTRSGFLDLGACRVVTPIFKNDTLLGYVQMDLDNRGAAALYRGVCWRSGLVVLLGLAALLMLGALLHLHLSHVQRGLTATLEAALAGRSPATGAPDVGDDFRSVGSFAQRLGGELHLAREGAEFARHDRDLLARLFQFGALMLGPNMELEFADESARNLLTGSKPEELATQLGLIIPALRRAAEALHDSGLLNHTLELDLNVDGRARRFRFELHTMNHSTPGRMLAVIKDQDMIDALEKDLRNAARFNGLATIFVGAVHDLRGPLNSMVVYLELMKQSLRRGLKSQGETEETAQQRKYIEVMQQEINRLNSYLQALLELTTPAKNVRSEMDVGQALTEIAGLMRVAAKVQGVVLDWQLPEKPLRLVCNPVQLRQAFLNIVINALEALPNGGVLSLRASATDEAIIIEVCDNGSGIPEALQARIFDLHFTTKEARTGIGLYVARSVIEEAGGTLEVQSKLACGACFRARLPKENPAESAANTPLFNAPG